MKNIILTTIIFIAFSCASKEERVKSYCNSEGAYTKGYQDGKNDIMLSSKSLDFCPNSSIHYPNYKQGYLEGQKNRLKEPTDSAFGASLNPGLPRKCILRFRGDTFLGEGFSYGEAQLNAHQKCKRQYGESCHMICENI
jgi:hypothetical protein